MKTTHLILAALPLFSFVSCSSVGYEDPDKVETLTIDFGSTDLQTMAAAMVTSLTSSPALAYFDNPNKGSDKRVIMYMGAVVNRTSEHIDTEGITDSIRSSLLQGGRFRFVTGQQGQAEVGEQVRFQQGSGRVDPTQARAFGKQIGAEALLYGTLRSIEKTKGRTLEGGLMKKEDVYYQFVLECVNIETGEIVWSNIKDIRKGEKRGLFG
ncbi:MAG: penicillin-binding protein activator LpoB [Planctomycetes bacterium]|nr:penicillin-binding protein activator LpoB [Planctomycetota bacterium]